MQPIECNRNLKKFTIDQEALINLVCPDKLNFLEKRLNHYENIFEYNVELKLKSLQFIEFKEITETNEVLVYFGPAIAIENTYIYFLLDMINLILKNYAGKKIYLLAEIQNPKLFFKLREFFGEIAGPKDFNFISKKEANNLEKFYKQFSHLLDPRLNDGWISKSNSNKNFCTQKLAKSEENKNLLESGINLLEMQQILFLVEFPSDLKEQRNTFENLKEKLQTKNESKNIFQLLLKSKSEQNGTSYILRPN